MVCASFVCAPACVSLCIEIFSVIELFAVIEIELLAVIEIELLESLTGDPKPSW